MNEFELIRQFFQKQPALLPAGHPDSLLPAPVPESQPGSGPGSGAASGAGTVVNALAGDASAQTELVPDERDGADHRRRPSVDPRSRQESLRRELLSASGAGFSGSASASQVSSPADDVLLGIGDDCALLDVGRRPGQALAVSSDMLVAGRHFFEGTDPAAIGHKALAVNLSDLAAMGARPVGFTLALALPEADPPWLAAFSRGLLSLASRAACPLVGGDTARGPLNICITVMGEVPAAQALRRDGARPGDDLWVTGTLGGAALAVAQRSQGLPVDEQAARLLDWPMPRLDVGLALPGLATAAMDISDGLAGDLGHLLAASARSCGQPLGADVWLDALPLSPALLSATPDRAVEYTVNPSHAKAGDTRHPHARGGFSDRTEQGGSWDGAAEVADRSMPVRGTALSQALQHALHGGDDYQLLFTAPSERADILRERFPDVRKIGRITTRGAIFLVDEQGHETPVRAHGHDHFST